MFGLGGGEILLILVIALIVLGPAKLPEIAKSLGKGLREFRKATSDFQRQVTDETDDLERRARPFPPRPPENTKAGAPADAARAQSRDDHGAAGEAAEQVEVPVEVDARPGPPRTPRVVAARDAIPRSPNPQPEPAAVQAADPPTEPEPG